MKVVHQLQDLHRESVYHLFPRTKVTMGHRVWTFSLQGSVSGYCEPRETLGQLGEYSSVELAVWDGGSYSGHFVSVSDVFTALGRPDLFMEFDWSFEPTGWVNWTDLEKIFAELQAAGAEILVGALVSGHDYPTGSDLGVATRRNRRRARKGLKWKLGKHGS